MSKREQLGIQSMAIIILNWNGFDDTVTCLNSLLKIDFPSYKVVIVDNGSTIDEATKLRNLFGNVVDIIRLNSNLGYTGGCNAGIEFALEKYNSDYILLLNNDTEVDPNFLDFLVETSQSDPKIGIAGSILIDYVNRDKINYSGGGINWLLAKHYRRSSPINQVKKTTIVTGCSMLIKKEVIEKIGLLDDDFFAYFEDSIYCLKAQKAGYHCVCDPRSIVYHKEQGSTGHKSKIYTYLMSRNRILYVNKYTPLFYRFYFLFFISLKLLAVQIFFLLTGQTARAYAFRKGFVDGMRGVVGPPPKL